MNPAAILSLISDLYCQLTALTQERDQLAAALAAAQQELQRHPAKP